MNRSYSSLLTIVLTCFTLLVYGQRKSPKSNLIVEVDVVKDFGAVPNDGKNDSEAFRKASEFIRKRGGYTKLLIPSGKYLIGKQTLTTNKNYYYQGESIINLSNCQDVTIAGNKNSILIYDVGFRFGGFNPSTGLSSNLSWDCSDKKKYSTSQRATLGNAITIINCKNVTVSNLIIDGNFYPETLNNMNSFDIRYIFSKKSAYQKDKINLGGGYGNCGIQLQHYGIYIQNSGTVLIKNNTIQRFGTDGIYISNSHKNRQHDNIEIDNNTIDYNARTGIAVTGGNQIRISNNSISNTGKCIFFSTGTGIDIEAQKKDGKDPILVTNLNVNNNRLKNNTSGEILSRFGNGSENVTITENYIEDVTRALNLNSAKNRNYNISDNKFIGRGVILIDGKEWKTQKAKSAINLKTYNNKFIEQ